jgi:sulfite reductase alpha subunit-like flavoprotein
LFEDNAEYGLGMFTAMKHRRERLITYVQDYVHHHELRDDDAQSQHEKELVSLFLDWLEVREEKSDKCTLLFDKMKPLFTVLLPTTETPSSKPSLLAQIWSERDMFPKVSQWIAGGDGWAYDIGFGGLDHVEAFEANDVNVLVVDTEMYSNTGGQQSKATPAGAAVAFAMGGKQQKKKSLGEIFMTYEHVYVASVCLSNQAQTLQAFMEADQHNGPSIIIAYSPCIQQGVRPQGLNDMIDECKFAVDSGYWPLYRYNPVLSNEGKNPFILDCKKLRKDVTAFLQRESRFINLKKKDPERAELLWENQNKDVHHRMDHLQQLAMGYKAYDHPDDAPVMTLFASETGTAARVARDFAAACTLSPIASAMDDVDLEDLNGKTTVFFIATCGQGAMPQNGKRFLKELSKRTEPFTEGTRFMVFGLGDSSYFFFVKAAREVEMKMEELGAKKMLALGLGDDSADEGMEQGLHDWLEGVWAALEVPPPAEVPHIIPVKALFSEKAVIRPEDDHRALEQFFHSDDIKAVSVPVVSNEMMCRPDYNRDFRTIRVAKGSDLEYDLGDALEIFPRNDKEKVADFLHQYSSEFGETTVVKLHAFGIDGDISLGALFTYVLDLFGKPSKHFLQQLATFETDEEERAIMLNPDFLKKACKQTGMTVADALLRFKKAQPPLPALLAMIPVIKPRAYSIASAPLKSNGIIELLVLIETWWCEDGIRYGLTCDTLRKLRSGDNIWCRMKAGSMEPPTPQQPVVCAGIGSGLAPHMAFLRDHVRAVEEGETVAPFSLFFGNRFVADEFLYQSELEAYAAKYDWFKLHTAFSRDDPKKKVYVQDLVEMTDDARLLLYETPDGLIYVCGNRNLPKPLQDALVKSFSQHSEDPKVTAAASEAVVELYIRGRAQQEVW